jgi:branched-chain amino acid transport system substrate-binding protein
MRNQPTPFARLVALAVGGLLIAGSCSSDDDGEDTTPPETTEPAETTPATTVAPPDEPLRLGVVLPEVGSFARLAAAQAAAVELALADVNEAGGVFGQPVESVTANQQLGDAVDVALRELADQGVAALVGPALSADVEVALPVLDELDQVACSASSTRPGLNQPGRLVRTALDDRVVAINAANYLTGRFADAEAPPSVAILHRDDDYGAGVAGVLRSALEYAFEGVTVTDVAYPSEATLFTSEVDQIASLGADAVVIVSLGEGINAARELLAAGVAPTTLIGLDGLASPRLAEQIAGDDPAAADGFTVIGTSGDLAFLERLLAEADQVLYGGQAYDCVIAFALAAEASASNDPATVAAAVPGVTSGGEPCTTYADCLAKLRAGDDIDYDGPSGPLEIDDQGQAGAGRFITASVSGGQLSIDESTRVVVADVLEDVAGRLALQQAQLTAALQADLRDLGYYQGPVDGIFTDEVSAAIAAFQADNGLEPTGLPDEATVQAIADAAEGRTAALMVATAQLQAELAALGLYTGPIDGIYSAETADAVRALQAQLGVPQTGILDAATVRAAYEAGYQAGGQPPATTVPATTTPGTTAPPETTAPPAPSETTVLDAIAATPGLTTFAALLDSPELAGLKAELADPGRRFTVLAPSNEALEGVTPDPATLDRLVRFHVLRGAFDTADLLPGSYATLAEGLEATVSTDGGTLAVGGIPVVGIDITADNGMVHVLGGVMTPPG